MPEMPVYRPETHEVSHPANDETLCRANLVFQATSAVKVMFLPLIRITPRSGLISRFAPPHIESYIHPGAVLAARLLNEGMRCCWGAGSHVGWGRRINKLCSARHAP